MNKTTYGLWKSLSFLLITFLAFNHGHFIAGSGQLYAKSIQADSSESTPSKLQRTGTDIWGISWSGKFQFKSQTGSISWKLRGDSPGQAGHLEMTFPIAGDSETLRGRIFKTSNSANDMKQTTNLQLTAEIQHQIKNTTNGKKQIPVEDKILLNIDGLLLNDPDHRIAIFRGRMRFSENAFQTIDLEGVEQPLSVILWTFYPPISESPIKK